MRGEDRTVRQRARRSRLAAACCGFAGALALVGGCVPGERLDWITVAPDGSGFVRHPSGRPFVPWGFNYDHDEHGRLLEEYWLAEWPKVASDFREMRDLGANVVRVHLQVGRFLSGPDTTRPEALRQLRRLLDLAGSLGLYVDITGLGCYLKENVPDWYDALAETDRWDVQAFFWKTIAAAGAHRPGVFCYDLMNEPVVPGGRRPPGAWLGPPFAGRYHYVQFVTLDQADRPRSDIARTWIHHLATGIRQIDCRHLITVGLVPWSLDRPGLTSGFVPDAIAADLDFLSVHIYPESAELNAALETARGFSVGKPVLIEELFPLRCSPDKLATWVRQSRPWVHGWISFYWGRTIEECERSDALPDRLIANWLRVFRAGPP